MSAGATISFNLTIIDDNVADDNYFYFYYYYYPGEVGIDLGIYQSDGTVYCNYSYIRIEDNDGKELHYIALLYFAWATQRHRQGCIRHTALFLNGP